MREIDGRIVWAPRVPRGRIRLLYESDAAGIVDESMIDEVGYAFWERCRDILICTRAHTGEATCPRCETIVHHGWRKDEMMRCDCGWSMTWGDYLGSYQGKQLHGGGSVPWISEYIDELERATTPRRRMLAIDRLINRFHWDLKHPERDGGPHAPSRPTAVNLIGGKMREVLALLDELAGMGEPDDPERRQLRRDFEASREANVIGWVRR